MATPREIQRRIRSVTSTSQITRAMEMVSAVKMRRAQQNVRASRPYSERLRLMISALSGFLDADPKEFPLLAHRPVNRTSLIVVTADRGLAGALNSNVLRRALAFLQETEGPTDIIAVGRKGSEFFSRTGYNMVAEFSGLGDLPTIDQTRPIIDLAVGDFERGRVDAVHVIYTQFVNTLSQHPVSLQLLPIEPVEDVAAQEQVRDFIFEPDRDTVLNALLPRYVEVQLYQALLEASASEHSARNVAMRNATDNAKDLIQDLTLLYNRVRQAQITAEVSEIASGAAAVE